MTNSVQDSLILQLSASIQGVSFKSKQNMKPVTLTAYLDVMTVMMMMAAATFLMVMTIVLMMMMITMMMEARMTVLVLLWWRRG